MRDEPVEDIWHVAGVMYEESTFESLQYPELNWECTIKVAGASGADFLIVDLSSTHTISDMPESEL
jgi:hypothetical protein